MKTSNACRTEEGNRLVPNPRRKGGSNVKINIIEIFVDDMKSSEISQDQA
jgi:hypothetical protein